MFSTEREYPITQILKNHSHRMFSTEREYPITQILKNHSHRMFSTERGYPITQILKNHSHRMFSHRETNQTIIKHDVVERYYSLQVSPIEFLQASLKPVSMICKTDLSDFTSLSLLLNEVDEDDTLLRSQCD